MKKGSISVAYKVQVDCLKDSESGSYDENDMKEKVRLYEAMQKNSKQHRFQKKSKFFPWYQISGLECTVQNILNTFKKIKKVGGILAKSASKKRKTTTTETLHLVTNVYEYDNFSR